MRFSFDVSSDLLPGAKKIASLLGCEVGEGGITVKAMTAEAPGVSLSGGVATIYYNKKNQFFREIGVLAEAAKKSDDLDITENNHFDMIGVMLQATYTVPTVASTKKLIDYLAVMGYDMLMLYTEYTLELDNRPYFGYMAGKYSDADIREIDDYCYSYGIELIPCFECYGHMGGYLQWPEAADIKDTADVMLARSEKTFAFLDEIMKKASALFRSRRVHIGMDEAHSMGTGKFLEQNGYVERSVIFEEYMERLAAICKSHGLTPMMWSDMYFRNADPDRWYYNVGTKVPKTVRDKVPENVELIFWHYGEDEGCDDGMIKNHLEFNRKVIFASGTWSWAGHFPESEYAYTTVRDSLEACRNNGVREFMATIWNKGECDIFSNLLALSMSAELCYDKKPDMAKLKSRFEATTGGIFEAFWDMSLYHNDFSNPAEYEGRFGHHKRFFGKVIFWQDVLMGKYDFDIYNRPMSEHYKRAHMKYEKYEGGEWDYIYKYVATTLKYLAIKSEIAEKLKPAYMAGDKATLTHIKDVLFPELYELTEAVYLANKNAWMRDFKTLTVKILNTRYGFMKERIKTAIEFLDMYLSGELDKLEELEEPRLKSKYFGFDNYQKIAGV